MNEINCLTKRFLINSNRLNYPLNQIANELSERLYNNKGVSLEPMNENDDEVTDLILNNYKHLLSDMRKELKYTFIEFSKDKLEFEHSSIKLFFDHGTHEEKEKHHKNSFRISEKPDLSMIKKENFHNKYGVITNIYRDMNSRDISVVGAEFNVERNTVFSYGREKDFEAAEVSALLELLERITTYNIKKEVVESSLDSGGSAFVDPSGMLHYNYDLCSIHRFEKTKSYKWLKCMDVKKAKEVYLPLQFFDLQAEADKRFVLETSNGVALGTSQEEARLYALLELIERDAFLLFWYRQIQLRKICCDSIPNELQDMIYNYETPQTKIHLFDMTIEIQIPTILCLITSKDTNLATYISTATHINPNIAIKNALDEAIIGHAIYNQNPNIGKRSYSDYTDVKEMFDHIDLASSTDTIKSYEFLTQQEQYYCIEELYRDYREEYGNFETIGSVLKYVEQQKMKNHETIYFADLSNEMIKEYGLFSTKAIVPSMLTMTFGYTYSRINMPRLKAGIDHSLEYKDKATIEEGCFYDKPHSFP
ncbi:ribosomal protein S12 methylthiotransferase accessory factor [Gracilibacillus orientalis]|uniref:Ribosomal protein S12 methylthiotransferase accessory factor n=1 Tax=Gracilibacillus orientalis TaxID=334253 RepID=A0A1I4J7U6_9BACI|nr:YcaO-like family protein [Gracilibacillus orientalis]SFL62243.1 ribosomal protein S12 methylthiotransferase accessory factor [Gracilibacillus orientalis]